MLAVLKLSLAIFKQIKEFLPVVSGPAKKILYEKFPGLKDYSILEALRLSDWILAGTGWQSNHEWNVMKMGLEREKLVVAYLDHWVNFPERFIRDEIAVLPTEIWVGDLMAKTIAGKHFCSSRIRLVPNQHFQMFKQEYQNYLSRSSEAVSFRKTALIISENINKPHITQHEIIEQTLINIQRVRPAFDEVLIRLHPSEPECKYDNFISNDYPKVLISSEKTLAEDFVRSDVVIGCNSMALVLANLVGKFVISCADEHQIPLVLPINGINPISSFLTSNL